MLISKESFVLKTCYSHSLMQIISIFSGADILCEDNIGRYMYFLKLLDYFDRVHRVNRSILEVTERLNVIFITKFIYLKLFSNSNNITRTSGYLKLTDPNKITEAT